jgi:hypothetical protein
MKRIGLMMGCAFLILIFSCKHRIVAEPENKMKFERNNVRIEKMGVMEFDSWGFNWNRQYFNGYLMNAILGDYLFEKFAHYKYEPYKGEGQQYWEKLQNKYPYINFFIPEELLDCKLVMKWNNAIIADKNCTINKPDETIGWITFHFSMNKNAEKWSHYRKFIASRATDYSEGGVWYDEAGRKLGLTCCDWPNLILVEVLNEGPVPFYFYEPYESLYGEGYGKYKLNY